MGWHTNVRTSGSNSITLYPSINNSYVHQSPSHTSLALTQYECTGHPVQGEVWGHLQPTHKEVPPDVPLGLINL